MHTAIGRTQVTLTDELASLRRLAADQATSVAELVRRAVDRLLASSAGGRAGARRQALAVVGRFASGRSDVAEEHDRWHGVAAAVWRELVESGEALVTHNYVLVKAFALVQRRLGMEAARALAQDVAPVLEVAFVDGRLHELAVASLLASGQRGLSLVDWASFVFMRRGATRWPSPSARTSPPRASGCCRHALKAKSMLEKCVCGPLASLSMAAGVRRPGSPWQEGTLVCGSAPWRPTGRAAQCHREVQDRSILDCTHLGRGRRLRKSATWPWNRVHS